MTRGSAAFAATLVALGVEAGGAGALVRLGTAFAVLGEGETAAAGNGVTGEAGLGSRRKRFIGLMRWKNPRFSVFGSDAGAGRGNGGGRLAAATSLDG